jgi:UDP:flavonoid glycosyltransferase YjiC (YdhE family)
LRTYECVGGELAAAVDRVLADEQLRARCAAAGERLRRRPGTELAADLIEALV